jgi:hypothetical protein
MASLVGAIAGLRGRRARAAVAARRVQPWRRTVCNCGLHLHGVGGLPGRTVLEPSDLVVAVQFMSIFGYCSRRPRTSGKCHPGSYS